MKRHRSNIILFLYRRVLLFYPKAFRATHGDAMLQTLRDALSDPATKTARLCLNLVIDLLQSAPKERYAMLQQTLGRRILLFNAAMLAVICSVLALAISASIQQVQRHDANDPQIQMVRDASSLLEHGAPFDAALPANRVDASSSLNPFLIIYDDAGKPVASSASLEGRVPTPPPGVFDYVRQHAEDWITWQPRPGVRLASIVKRVAGPHPGFVLAARSLQQVEERKQVVGNRMTLGWAVTMALLCAGTGVLMWTTRRDKANGVA